MADDQVKEPDVSKEHPELHHYTTKAGLRGIVTSNSLWSVRYDCMNDPGEFVHARKLLTSEFETRLKAYLRKRGEQDFSFSLHTESMGGVDTVVEHEVQNWIDVAYQAFFTIDGDPKIPFYVPHVTSFCSHVGDMPYEQENGLLSQWRGYGREGAFAIVFDTAKLEELFKQEYRQYGYIHAQFLDVHYDREPGVIRVAYAKSIDKMISAYTNYIIDRKPIDLDFVTEFQTIIGRLKHQAFHEEREVRLITYPLHQEFRDYKIRQGDKTPVLRKPLKVFHEDGPKPHITLFGDKAAPLPIKRVIVGPTANQLEELAEARGLADDRWEVVPSATPYRA